MRISDWSSDVCSSDLRCEPDRGTFGHDEQRDRGEDRAGEEIGAAAAEATEPGAVAHMADDRLDEQPGQRRRDPQARQSLDILAERLEDAAHIGVLEREADLEAEKAEADVPQAARKSAV